MSSIDDIPPVVPPFSIQDIVSKLKQLTKECEAKVDPPKQTTDGTNTTAADNDGTKNDKKRQTEVKINDDGRKKALRELEKLCKELDYMLRSFLKLEEFEKNLREPLETLETNVNDILEDLGKPDLPKQVHNNLRVLRNNITRVKITIPAQHQTASLNSEGTRGLQTTVATGDAGDLPHLYSESKEEEDIFAKSYYFKEIKGKYESLDTREKLCLLCFAIFPENAVIKKRFLRFWWVGENLLPLKSGHDEKEVLNATLSRYVEKRLIEPILKKNKLEPRSYTMNPIVRSCLIKFAKEARFFDYDSEGKPIMDFSSCNKACMVKSEEGARAPWFSEYLRGDQKAEEDKKTEMAEEQQQEQENTKEQQQQQQQGQEKTKQQDNTKQQQQEQEKLSADLVKLQMLFNFPSRDALEKASKKFDGLQTLFNLNKQFPALPEGWFPKMTGLQVLYLGKWETTAGSARHIEVEDINFLKELKNMKKLRLLSLQGISGIPKIPSTLGKLESLRILDLRACHNLEKLPDRIGLLKKLTYLDLSECYLLDYIPKRLKELQELQVLKGFMIVETRDSCTLDDLSYLENLRKLSINVNTTEFNINGAEAALTKFQKLEKLRITWGSGGMPKEGSTQGSSGEQQSKKKAEDKANSDTKKSKEAVEKKRQNAGSTRGNSCEQQSKTNADDKVNSNTKKPEEAADKKGQNAGIKQVANRIMMANRFLKREKEDRKLEGLANLVKLDLQCFPWSEPPKWLQPTKMKSLTNLSIRGGKLGHLDHEGKTWKVDTLRLKFLVDFKMNWKEMQVRFPNLKYLEKVRSPRITFCPCDANGVWQKSSK